MANIRTFEEYKYKKEGIPVDDVKQIAYEVGLWAIDIEKTKKIGKPSDVEFKEKFDNWIEDRLKMIIDRGKIQKKDGLR